MGIPGTTCHSSAHPRARVCVYTCTRARAHLRGAPELPAARERDEGERGPVGDAEGEGGREGGLLNRMHRSTDPIAVTGEKKWQDVTLKRAWRILIGRSFRTGTPGDTDSFLFFFLLFFDKLKGVRSGRGIEGWGRGRGRARRGDCSFHQDLGIRYDVEYPGFLAIVWYQAEDRIYLSPRMRYAYLCLRMRRSVSLRELIYNIYFFLFFTVIVRNLATGEKISSALEMNRDRSRWIATSRTFGVLAISRSITGNVSA